MNISAIAKDLVPLLGGKENIVSAAHCATRLRLVLADDSKVNKAAIDKLEGVKGCFSNAGQIQVIFGTGLVNKVYAEFVTLTGTGTASKAELTDMATAKLNVAQRLARTLSNIFVPIIPAIVASGLLMGLLGMVRTYGWVNADSALFVMLDMFSSAAFIILPILIGFTAAREFGGNPYLGATLGGILTHPALTNAWGVAGGFKTMDFFGLDVAMIGYQGTVFPVLLAVWFMSHLEKQLRKRIPDALDLILTPFLTVIITGFVALLFIGPAGRVLGDGISFGLSALYEQAGWLAGLVFGGTYSLIVITGIPLIIADRVIGGGNGTAGVAASSAAGAAVANPVIIAQINPAFEPVAASATALVAASVIVTAILVPIITALYAKRFNKNLVANETVSTPADSLHH